MQEFRCSSTAFLPGSIEASAISLYRARVRVEMMFAMRQSVLGAFAYRFWSRYLPRHSRKPKKNAALKRPEGRHVPTLQQT